MVDQAVTRLYRSSHGQSQADFRGFGQTPPLLCTFLNGVKLQNTSWSSSQGLKTAIKILDPGHKREYSSMASPCTSNKLARKLSMSILPYTHRVVVITTGVSSFVWCKRDIDRRRLEALKLGQREKRKRRPLTIGNAGRHV